EILNFIPPQDFRLPNGEWLGALSVYTAVKALEGKDVPAFVKVPLPVIDDSTFYSFTHCFAGGGLLQAVEVAVAVGNAI
ncbi:hypothetical protein ACC745_39325, partial [Rhizobium ruizarguesonis]